MIRTAEEQDYEKLADFFKEFFTTHNIFQQPKDKITSYLKEQAKENRLIIYEESNEIKTALFLVNFGQSSDDSHKLWKFRHFAFTSEEAASKLLQEAENRIKKDKKVKT